MPYKADRPHSPAGGVLENMEFRSYTDNEITCGCMYVYIQYTPMPTSNVMCYRRTQLSVLLNVTKLENVLDFLYHF